MALEKKLADFKNALSRLEESHDRSIVLQKSEAFSFYRDSTIQRFEFTLEIAWKSVKTFLLEVEGIECRSPKSCIREFFTTAHLDKSQTQMMLQMVDDRNLATHTYHEALADEIFASIKTYITLFHSIHSELSSSI
jgi:nucleotidyltransferase substrate binding protein (TIGR01987 family)